MRAPRARQRHRDVILLFHNGLLFGWCGPDGVEVVAERTLPRELVLDVAAFAAERFRWLVHREATESRAVITAVACT